MNTLNLQPATFMAPPVKAPVVGLAPVRFESIDVAVDRPPTFWTLVLIEARKMRDTKSGLAVAATMLAITVLIPVIQLIVLAQGGVDLILFSGFYIGAATGASFLLPVMVVLLIAGEWTQRTALTTFALVPNRGRVLLAKLATAVGATVVVFLTMISVAAIANAVSGAFGNPNVVWDMHLGDLVTALSMLMSNILIAFAFGALLRNTAGALVAFYSIWLVLPVTLSPLADFRPVAIFTDWTDLTTGIPELADAVSSVSAWAHVAVGVCVWIVVPLVVGVRKILTMEIR